MLKTYFILTLFNCFYFALGQCCSGGVPLSSSVGLPIEEMGTLQLNFQYNWNHLARLKSGDKLLNDQLRQRDTHALLFASGYRFSQRFSLDFFGSIVRQERQILTHTGNRTFVFTQGLGDVVLLPKYHFNKTLVLGLGIKLPSGRSNFNDPNNIALPADLQPGSGAIDWIPYIHYQVSFNRRPSLEFSTKLTFRATGKNNRYFNTNNTYQFGNELQWQGNFSDQFIIYKSLIDTSLGLRFRTAARDFFNEQAFPGSGGHFVFVSGGFSLPLVRGISWQISTSLPVYSFVNETQLTPNLTFGFGLFWRIGKKQTFSTLPLTSNLNDI